MKRVATVTCWIVACAGVALAEPLPGTAPLTSEGDLASRMVEGIDRFLLDETDQALARRDAIWGKALDPQERRRRLAKRIGAIDQREAVADAPLGVAGGWPGAPIAKTKRIAAFAVRWPVFHGVEVEGILLTPAARDGEAVGPVAHVVALPDADQTPEMICGLLPGLPPERQFARRLAESGCRVVVPVLIDRSDTYSASSTNLGTNQPHREWVYRPAFEVGRHVIGYEVQKLRAAVDWMEKEARAAGKKIGVIGYGEGGLVALHGAALDERVDAACVSGYFGSRQAVWQEPIYRNVFGLLNEFGDAEVARLVSPRRLVVEACRSPQVDGPPAPRHGRKGAAPGRLTTPSLESVKREVDRANAGGSAAVELVVRGDGTGAFATEATLKAFLEALGAHLSDPGDAFDVEGAAIAAAVAPRLKRQLRQLSEHTQSVVRESEHTRRSFWSKADAARAARSSEKWEEATRWYRDYFYDEVIGRFDRPLLEPNVRTRRVYDEPKYVGYEVVMDVFPHVFAYGILLVPKDIKPGERRPVVVCQHGLEGRPQNLADPKVNHPSYNQYACRLAERGFVTYAPQNPYIFGDRFRTLQRKANPLGKTLFSIIVPQHQQATDWLASLPFVDPQRIAFYGLSYGGKTAMRVPPLVDRYCLSICSADFNEWIWKNTSVRSPYSYVHNIEYEIFEWDLGNTFNYAEMAGLICPRPFMVERGHRDGVAPDEWVAYEYAKVRMLYTDLKIPDRTTIEFFDGPHTIHGVGTFDFLHRQLNWPPPSQ